MKSMTTWLLCAFAGAALGAEINVLSAGAVEPGVRQVVAAFELASGDRVRIAFAAAPQIAEHLARGEAFDVVIAPLAVLNAAQQAGRIGADRVLRKPLDPGQVVGLVDEALASRAQP